MGGGWASLKGEHTGLRYTVGVAEVRPCPVRVGRTEGDEIREVAGPGPRGHGCQVSTFAFALSQRRSHGEFCTND